ncbi:MAG: S-adenosylmethionine:tRNA ribosyltransferase-isomerase [Paludibacteraceae bacterium]|nr:S-adenosylmethionine:tRNA ribosyltransferase-isomerase [Paludibacteraceae bacterium]
MEPIYIKEYDYPLTDERIAKYPLKERDQSKLLVYRPSEIREDRFRNVGEYILPGALLVYNNTRVIQARLEFHKWNSVESRSGSGAGKESKVESAMPVQGARIEVFCLEPIAPHDYQLSLGSTEGCTWKCMVGNAKKWKSGDLSLTLSSREGTSLTVSAYKEAQMGNTYAVRFEWDDRNVSFAEILDAVGELPIPPYLNRKTEESDKTTYQTVYSKIKGSVAAPTAGLHFTEQVLADLRARGIQTTELTLHVGAGTFLPVKTDDANKHTMHTEIIAVPRQAIEAIRDNLGKIVAVGTTSMRTLESLYFIGKQLADKTMDNGQWTMDNLHVGQFEPYGEVQRDKGQGTKDKVQRTKEALDAIVAYLRATRQETLHAETQIMIKPGYEFHVVDQLITNFHQPKSTLLLLVSAFVGDDWKRIYSYALEHDFRFLSYGDSSILSRRK